MSVLSSATRNVARNLLFNKTRAFTAASMGYEPMSCSIQQAMNLSSSSISRSILKGLSPILTADLLWVLRSAGHGDQIVVVDANFPANAIARQSTSGKHIELEGVDLPGALDAICEVFPLDYFVDSPAQYMGPTDGPMPPLGQEAIDEACKLIDHHCEGIAVQEIERFQFYDEAAKAFAIVQCVGERRPYANFILTKGVIGPDGKDLRP